MIFAELKYPDHYSDVHAELFALVSTEFSNVDGGLQGDSWIWILDGEEKVAIDTFTSMRHQIKSPRAGSHVQKVIDLLRRNYALDVYDEPEWEAHEGAE
jgi:hypothetical protein